MQRVSSFSSGTAYESFERLWTAGFKVEQPLMRRRPFWEGPHESTKLDFPVKFCWNLSHRANVKIILCQETAETVLWWQVMIGQGRLCKRFMRYWVYLFKYEGLYDVVEVKFNCLKMKIDHTVMKFDWNSTDKKHTIWWQRASLFEEKWCLYSYVLFHENATSFFTELDISAPKHVLKGSTLGKYAITF